MDLFSQHVDSPLIWVSSCVAPGDVETNMENKVRMLNRNEKIRTNLTDIFLVLSQRNQLHTHTANL